MAARRPGRGARPAEAGLAYRRYLVSIDERVSYDARTGRAMFDRQDELHRADLLEQRMQAALRDISAYLARGRGALTSLPDSVAAEFR